MRGIELLAPNGQYPMREAPVTLGASTYNHCWYPLLVPSGSPQRMEQHRNNTFQRAG